MTHFVGAVLVPPTVPFALSETATPFPGLYGEDAHEVTPGPELQEYLDNALAPFDEDLQVERWTPRKEIIAEGRQSIERYRDGLYAEYLALGPDGYRAARPSALETHLSYLEHEFPKRLLWTDDEVYANEVHEWQTVRADGARLDDDNPAAKWDWWRIGGRWEEAYRGRQGETVQDLLQSLAKAAAAVDLGVSSRPKPAPGEELEDPERLLPWWFPNSIVTPHEDSFRWVEQGQVGWFGLKEQGLSESDWIQRLIEITSSLDPETRVVYIDFHI